MERRGFFKFGIVALAAGVVSLFAGCSKTESAPKVHNQEKLWSMTAASQNVNEPIELAYAKDTPAFYRDASLGKEDPNFKPKTGGG
jgi:hypothetical protein